MSRWKRFLRWLGTSPSGAMFDATPRPIDQLIGEMLHGSAKISRADALSVTSVMRGRNMLCSVATLPLRQYDPDRNVVRNPLLEQLDPDVPNVVTLSQTVEDLVFDAVSWWEITAQDFAGYPVAVRHLDVGSVSLQPPASTRAQTPLPSGQDPHGAVVYINGVETPASRVIRFDSPNPAVLKAGARAIRRAILLDKAAGMYADDPRPLDYFTPAPGADPISDDEIKEFLGQWKAYRQRRSTAFVPEALAYNSVNTPSPAELQLNELQRQATLDIANALGVDPEDLGVSTTSRTYSNAVDRRRDRINDVLSPYMKAVTDRLSMGDVTRRGYVVEFYLDDYMRANPTERAAVQQTYVDMGVKTVDEIRAEEGLPPRANVAAADPAAVNAGGRRLTTFDKPGLQFADVPVREFSVDRSTRTISGIAMPYGEIGTKYGLKFKFARGALQWSDPAHVKLNTHHDVVDTVGYAVQLRNVGNELQTQFKVAPGPKGDQALSDAENHILDGMSVGVDFDMTTDTVPDPRDKTVVLVRRADLRHVALTPEPTFANARVTKVAASRNGGNMEECATCGQRHAPEAACTTAPQPQNPPANAPGTLTLTAEQVSALLARPGGLAALLGQPAPAGPAPEPEPARPTVNPTRQTASVTEPQSYRFDSQGNLLPGAHDFSTDLIAGLKDRDQAAYDRALEFAKANFDVVTTNVATLNPNVQRPDLFVDQREFRYPIWSAINKGTLSDKTPFVFPKFSSASGLVGAHTEGTEPTSGAYVATSQTVTPTANSGKAKISREVYDAGGNPQVSGLIWRQMQRGWYEALEAAAVAELDAASPTSLGTFTVGGGTNKQTLVAEMESYLSALQFVRGGFSMTDMATQIDLYQALIAAKDTTLRPYFPVIGPMNSRGTTNALFGAIDLNGVLAWPGWALAGTGIVVASSYLFDRQSVHGWASAPQRLDITMTEVANVYIGVWGYKATAISDINGIREVLYDPA